jgi:Leucine-rich repeat (LRR) protein
VPASLGKCAKLKHLRLEANQLEGAVPDELGQCGKLEGLDLQENQLTGGVPASLGKCSKLKHLRLEANQLEGAVPATELAKLTALEMLVLFRNEGLTITASGAQELKEALPNAKLLLPRDGTAGQRP